MGNTNTDIQYAPGSTISSSSNFGRLYRVKVYEHTQSSANSGDAKTDDQTFSKEKDGDIVLDVSNLRIVFKIQRFALYYPNSALITIYNLNADTENSIIQEGYRVVVEAGYPSNYGQIFDGEVLMCNRFKQDGTDYILNILAIDGNQFINEGFASFSYAKGQTARQVVQNICNKASNPIQLEYASPALDNIKFSKGAAVHGQPKTTLSDIARTINGTWWVDNGGLYMVAYSDSAAKLPGGYNQAIELNPKTGMLGNPQQVDYGVSVRSLLNPKVMPYGLIHIKSEYITEQLVQIGSYSQGATIPYVLDSEGLYRVCSVTFSGDSRGNDWYADMVAISQGGDMNSMLTNSSYTGN
jgi:hypothetical protein